MYRTVEFRSSLVVDEPQFDEDDNPISPGSRELAELIANRMKSRVRLISSVDQHEYYGWGFEAATDKATFYNVLNPAGEENYFTVSMDWYLIKLMLLRRPIESFEAYCALLTDTLEGIPGLSDFHWQDYRI